MKVSARVATWLNMCKMANEWRVTDKILQGEESGGLAERSTD